MLIASKAIDLFRGPVTEEELRGLTYTRSRPDGDLTERMGKRLRALEGTWLQRTLLSAPIKPEYPFPVPPSGLSFYRRPGVLAWAYLVVAIFLLYMLW